MKILLAILLGGAFGFVLQRVGATNASNIINMLALRDLKLMKLIVLAIALSSAASFALHALDPGLVHLSIKRAYVGVAIGGAVFGLGWALSGYCPGTSLGALGEGKVDLPGVIAAGGSHTEWHIVELDSCATDMVEAVKKSYAYLVDNGLSRGSK